MADLNQKQKIEDKAKIEAVDNLLAFLGRIEKPKTVIISKDNTNIVDEITEKMENVNLNSQQEPEQTQPEPEPKQAILDPSNEREANLRSLANTLVRELNELYDLINKSSSLKKHFNTFWKIPTERIEIIMTPGGQYYTTGIDGNHDAFSDISRLLEKIKDNYGKHKKVYDEVCKDGKCPDNAKYLGLDDGKFPDIQTSIETILKAAKQLAMTPVDKPKPLKDGSVASQ